MISMSQEDAKSVMKALDDFDGWADHGCPPSTEVAVKIMRGVLAEQPAQRTWVGLTDEEIAQGCKESWVTEQAWQSAVWWAEAKLKEKNT